MTQRKNIMLGTAGHVDHGKTSLVKMLTGCDTDRLAEEKRRGMTIELGFAPCRMRDERIVGVVDVPGHVDFIRNMAAGAQGVDVVVLVVAADDGVMPQTREHLDILTIMGVRHGLVALTKIDLVDQEMAELAMADVRSAMVGTFLENAAICPLSNITGVGYDGFFDALNAEVESCQERPCAGLFRMWVERSFSMHGFGTVASGIPCSGQVRVGQSLRVMPGGKEGKVRGLEVYGEEAQAGRAGECVAVNLAHVEPADLARTSLLCEGDCFPAVSMAEADLSLLPRLPSSLQDYAEVHVHVGTAEVMAHVAMLEGKPVEPGGRQLVQLRMAQPVAVAAGDRFVIRASLPGLAGGRVTTVGGGRILGASDTRLRRNRPWTIAMLSARREALDNPLAWCERMLAESAESAEPLSVEELSRRAQQPPDMTAALVEQMLQSRSAARTTGGLLVHGQNIDACAKSAVEALEKFHAENPMRAGMEERQLLESLAVNPQVLELALVELVGKGKLTRQPPVVWLNGRSARISDQDRKLYEQVESILKAAHLATPSAAELAVQLQLEPSRVEKVLRLLTDYGAIVVLDGKVLLHREAIKAGKKVALDLFAKQGGFTTMEFRDALAASRKYAVPLLDYLDTLRWTVRSTNRRTPGAEARAALKAAAGQAKAP